MEEDIALKSDKWKDKYKGKRVIFHDNTGIKNQATEMRNETQNEEKDVTQGPQVTLDDIKVLKVADVCSRAFWFLKIKFHAWADMQNFAGVYLGSILL